MVRFGQQRYATIAAVLDIVKALRMGAGSWLNYEDYDDHYTRTIIDMAALFVPIDARHFPMSKPNY